VALSYNGDDSVMPRPCQRDSTRGRRGGGVGMGGGDLRGWAVGAV
jgi:hypothetical protein